MGCCIKLEAGGGGGGRVAVSVDAIVAMASSTSSRMAGGSEGGIGFPVSLAEVKYIANANSGNVKYGASPIDARSLTSLVSFGFTPYFYRALTILPDLC